MLLVSMAETHSAASDEGGNIDGHNDPKLQCASVDARKWVVRQKRDVEAEAVAMRRLLVNGQEGVKRVDRRGNGIGSCGGRRRGASITTYRTLRYAIHDVLQSGNWLMRRSATWSLFIILFTMFYNLGIGLYGERRRKALITSNRTLRYTIYNIL